VPTAKILQAAVFACRRRGLRHPKLPLPGSTRGTKDLALGNHLSGVVLATNTVQSITDDESAPVVRHAVARKLNAEENDDGAERKTDVPSSRSDVVVLRPPTTVFITNVLVECPTDQDPRKLLKVSMRFGSVGELRELTMFMAV
jgi:hypothetical protein